MHLAPFRGAVVVDGEGGWWASWQQQGSTAAEAPPPASIDPLSHHTGTSTPPSHARQPNHPLASAGVLSTFCEGRWG